MSWHKLAIPFKDAGVAGRGQKLQEAFLAILIANAGMPRDAAMFSRRSDDFNVMFYYFSPAAVQMAKVLLEAHGATPCSAPLRGTVSLAVGDDRAREMLWPPDGRNDSQQ